MLFDMLRLPRAAIVPWGDDGDDVVAVVADGWCVRDEGRDDRVVVVVGELEAVLVEAVGCCWVSDSCKGCRGVEGEGNWFCESRRRGCDNWSNRDIETDIPVERLTDPRLDEAPDDEP